MDESKGKLDRSRFPITQNPRILHAPYIKIEIKHEKQSLGDRYLPKLSTFLAFIFALKKR